MLGFFLFDFYHFFYVEFSIFIFIFLLATALFMIKMKKKLIFSTLLGVWLIFETGVCVIGFLMLQLEIQIKEKLLGYAPVFAAVMAQMNHEQIVIDSKNSHLYEQLLEMQKKWLSQNQFIHDIYTMRKINQNDNVLLVDSETDYNRDGDFSDEMEARTLVGEKYEKKIKELELAFLGTPGITSSPYRDKWGFWVSAFVPIHVSKRGGKYFDVLGVDFKAEQYLGTLRFTLVVGLSMLLMLYSALLLLYWFYRRVELALILRTDFTARVGHELRTPLVGVLGLSQMLIDHHEQQEGKLDSDPEQTKIYNYYLGIKSSAQSLLEIINDILDFSKVSSSGFEISMRPINLKLFFDSIGLIYEPLCKSKKIFFDLKVLNNINQFILVDDLRLKQVIDNLLSNAIKFTDSGSIRLLVEVSPIEKKKDRSKILLKISITDSGPGMSPRFLKRLFTPYAQDEQLIRKVGIKGTGLGLAISKDIIEKMGGKITVESSEGKGSSFLISMKVNLCESEQDKNNSTPSLLGNAGITHYGEPVKRLLNMLVIDDVSTNNLILSSLLKKIESGHEEFKIKSIDSCTTVEQVRQISLENKDPNYYHLIFTDYHMPSIEPLDWLTMLATHFPKECIILCSAENFSKNQELQILKYVGHILNKPVNYASLEYFLSTQLNFFSSEKPKNVS